MSAAIIAGAAIGIGGTIYSVNAAGKSSDKAMKLLAQNAAKAEGYAQGSEEQWNKDMTKLSEIEKIFGSTRENLANYYDNMSADHYTKLGAEAMNNQMRLADENISGFYSNNGRFNSGSSESAQVSLQVARETASRNNSIGGEQAYVGAQQQWLQYGDSRIDTQQQQANFQQQITANYRANALGQQGILAANHQADADRASETGGAIAAIGGTLVGYGIDQAMKD